MSTALALLGLGTGICAAIAALLVGLGFLRLAIFDRGAMGRFARGLLLIHLAVLLRAFYRDIGPWLVEPETWARLFDPDTHLVVTILMNLMVLWSVHLSLRALYLVIPEEKRKHYSVLTAALYPPWDVIAALRSMLYRFRGRS